VVMTRVQVLNNEHGRKKLFKCGILKGCVFIDNK